MKSRNETRKSPATRTLIGVALALCLAGCEVAGPAGSNDDGFDCVGGRCDNGTSAASFQHRWAIDMDKVRAQSRYATSARFVAATPTDLLPEPLASMACERETVVASEDGGAVTEGGCFLWGNMQRRNYDHSLHVDDPANNPIVNIVDGGRMIDPPGYLNIIAQLNAERHDQTEIRQYLENGDILVYFHPEDQDTTQFRMHHAAMFYDTGEGPLAISLGGVPFVHHIDNPMSYGPAFNSGPSAPPFHVFRFSPNGAPGVGPRDEAGRFRFDCTDEIRGPGGPAECRAGEATFTITDDMAYNYAYIARNWAMLTNGNVPFSSFHNMTWNDPGQRASFGTTVAAEVDRWAAPILGAGQSPELYCAGLVFANLNLAMNRPLNEDGLGPELWSLFSTSSYSFDDRYLSIGSSPSAARDALTAADLEDRSGLPRMGRLAFEPIAASEIIDAWLEGYFGRLPRQARAQILAGAAERIAGGFRSLVWAATKDEEGREAAPVVATPERIRQYAMAYAAGDDDLYTIAVEDGELVVREGPDGRPDLPAMKELELRYVDNRYVPPPLYHVLANRADSLLTYVGSVIHVDLLSPIGDNDGNTGAGGVAEFFEGGPDTSLYEHFFVPNGGRHAQRVFDVTSGPGAVGNGSKVAVRLSAADVRDVRVVLHPAGSFAPLDSLYACDRNADCIGDAQGIPLPLDPALAGGATVWHDVDVSFELFAPVADGGLGCVLEGETAVCPAYDWETGQTSGTLRIDGAYGQWTVTTIDLGRSSDGASVPSCAACLEGGAHSNQWILTIRDDA